MFRLRFVLPLVACVFLVGSALAEPMDLTTFGWTSALVGQGTEQPRVSRYTVIMGEEYGETVGWITAPDPDVLFQGAYDYGSHRGNGDPWWRICNGVTTGSTNTFAGTDVEDFAGYQFKKAATVTEINFTNRVYRDGGVFDAAPRVEVLSAPLKRGGTWSTIPVTWNVAYDRSLAPSTAALYRQYTITPNAPTGEVWGVRLVGAPRSQGAPTSDPTGFIGVPELRVKGETSITKTIDLKKNLALGQTPLWSGTTHYNRPQILTDGIYQNYIANYYGYQNDYWGYEDTWGMDARDGKTYDEEYMGVMFSSPQVSVAAIGTTQKMFGDGGWILPGTTVVEYTTDGGTTWTPVTGLKMGRWAEDEAELKLLPWAYVHSELFTFNMISGPIDGIRMRGTPYGAGMSSDATGFLGSVEFEVFAAIPEPGTLALMVGLVAGVLVWRIRRR